MTPQRWAATAASALALLLGACSSTDKPKPTALEEFTPGLAARQVWSTRIDSVSFPLAPSAREGRFVVASGDGTVLALDADSGRELWRTAVGTPLSAGVGGDGRFAAVVTRDSELVVLEGGNVKWRQRMGSRVSTPPLVAGERVFVMGVDRAVLAFDALDGRRLWTLQRPGDALTLAQPGVVTAFNDTLIVGQGPRLAGVDPLQGTLRWEVPLASPRGTNEVERLADLVGPASRVGHTLCARAFQAAVGCVDGERGSLLWTKNVGGTDAVGGDADYVFGADASDRITAWRTPSGDVAWTSERLLYRGLSGAVSVGRALVFGDSEGQVHFLDRDSGRTLLRLPTDGSPVVGTPVVSGNILLVVTKGGGLFAFRPD